MKKYLNTLLLMSSVILLITSSCSKDKSYSNADEWVDDIKGNLKSTSVEELKAKIDNYEMFYLVDVRENMEHNYGYIPSSINIPGGSLIFKIDNKEFWEQEMLYVPQKTDEIIVYCKKGKRSIIAADALRKLGYTNIKYLDGGWKNWELTYPLEYDKNEVTGHHEEAKEVGGC